VGKELFCTIDLDPLRCGHGWFGFAAIDV
jgi:hypothetical protein